MKRLIKNSQYEDFIENWYNSWGTVSQEEIQKIIDDNPQFNYSGEAWRWIELPKLKDIISKQSECLNYDDIINIAKQYIKSDDRFYSWSQDYSLTEDYALDNINNEHDIDFGVIIESNINGLNYYKFLKNYNNDFNEISEIEKEVIAKQNEYTIVSIIIKHDNDIDIYDNDNPCKIIYKDNNILIEYLDNE